MEKNESVEIIAVWFSSPGFVVGTVYAITIDFSKPDSQAERFVATFCFPPLYAALSLLDWDMLRVELLKSDGFAKLFDFSNSI